MSQSIAVSDPAYALLQREAERERLSPDALAERLLRERLSQEAATWREALEAVILRVQSRALHFSSAEIEAEITSASEEARELRRAGRSR